MASFSVSLIAFFIFLLHGGSGECSNGGGRGGNPKGGGGGGGGGYSKQFADVDYLTFALNLEYLETDFFLCGATGDDLDSVDPELAGGGPKPIGCKQAMFHQDWIASIIKQFALQEIGHLRIIQKNTQGSGFPRPQLDLTKKLFANIIDNAVGRKLNPPFDPYDNDINFLIGSYLVPYVGLTAYVGAAPNLQDPAYKKLVAGLLAVEAGQDAVLRTILFQFKDYKIDNSGITVENITNSISALRNKLGNKGTKDEGLVVEPSQGAEGKIADNVLAGDENSLAYDREPDEVIRILYGNTVMKPSGFFPNGVKGKIADSYRK